MTKQILAFLFCFIRELNPHPSHGRHRRRRILLPCFANAKPLPEAGNNNYLGSECDHLPEAGNNNYLGSECDHRLICREADNDRLDLEPDLEGMRFLGA
jgi:hypothetical protein